MNYIYLLVCKVNTYIVLLFLFYSDNIPLRSTKPYSHNFQQGHWNSNAKARKHVRDESIYCLCYFGFDMDFVIWNSCTNF